MSVIEIVLIMLVVQHIIEESHFLMVFVDFLQNGIRVFVYRHYLFLLGYLLPAGKKDADEEVQLISEAEIRKLVEGETETVRFLLAVFRLVSLIDPLCLFLHLPGHLLSEIGLVYQARENARLRDGG